MSQTELQRFAAAIQAEPARLEAYRSIATPEAFGAKLRADGYDVSDDELRAAQGAGTALSDEQLDQVAGGFVLETLVIAGLMTVFGVAGAMAGAVAYNVAEVAKKS